MAGLGCLCGRSTDFVMRPWCVPSPHEMATLQMLHTKRLILGGALGNAPPRPKVHLATFAPFPAPTPPRGAQKSEKVNKKVKK